MKQAIACPLNSMLAAVISLHPASQFECEQSAARNARPGAEPRAANQCANHGDGPRKRGPLQSVPDDLKQPRELLPVLLVSEV
jgi:hypothetical protein